MREAYNIQDYIEKHIIGRLENLMNGGGMYDDVSWQDYPMDVVSRIKKDEDYGYFLHKLMKPYYQMYLMGDMRLCRKNMENMRLFMKSVIEEDKAFGSWASTQNLTAMAEGWGDNMKRIEEPKRMNQYFQVLEHLFNSGCQQDWMKLSEELKEDLFKAEVYSDYKNDELLCVLHAFTMIMQQDWELEEKREQLSLLFKHWKFLKYYYSIMIRHIVGVKYTRWTDVTNTVMTSSSSFNPHLHIYYCGLTERMDSLGLDYKHYKKLDDIRLQMLEMINRFEPAETLYTLCDAVFPEDFQRMLNTHRPKSYGELEDENKKKDLLLKELRQQTQDTRDQIERLTKMLKAAVEASIPIEDIERELMSLPANTAWDIFNSMNELLQDHDIWRRYDRDIRKKLKERLAKQDERQDELNEALKKNLAEPRYKVYPQAGSTANVGCDQKNSDFKNYLAGTATQEGQAKLESINKEKNLKRKLME